MKKIVLCVLVALPAIAFSQDSCLIDYSGIIKVDSSSKTQLYERARSWFANTFKDSKSVLQVSDKESGELIGKAKFPFESDFFVGQKESKGAISYTITVLVKDGRYKFELNNFVHQSFSQDADSYSMGELKKEGCSNDDMMIWTSRVKKAARVQIKDYADNLIGSLQSEMVKDAAASDW